MAWDDVLVAHVSKYTAAIHNEIINQIKARILHSLSTAENDFLVGAPTGGSFVKKTLAEVKTILGLGSAAYTASTEYAAASHASDTSNPHSVTAAQVGAATEAYADKYKSPRVVARMAKGYTALGVECIIRSDAPFDYPTTGTDGTYAFFYLFCDGGETHLDINYHSDSDSCKFDLYINGSLDSSGYDLYSASYSGGVLVVTLTRTILAGWNEIKLVVNGKNSSSSGYLLGLFPMRIRV